MDEVMKMGPFLIKGSMVSILGSGLLGYWLMKYRMKGIEGEKTDKMADTIGTVIFMSFLIWKLSLIVLTPISVIHNPSIIMYFSGGYRGWILAFIFVFIYVLYQSKAESIPLSRYLQWIGLGFSTANFLYYLIHIFVEITDTGFHLGQMILSLGFIGWFYQKDAAADRYFQRFIWFGIGQIFLFFFKGVHLALWLGLSREQWIFFVVTLIGFIGSWIQRKWLYFNES